MESEGHTQICWGELLADMNSIVAHFNRAELYREDLWAKIFVVVVSILNRQVIDDPLIGSYGSKEIADSDGISLICSEMSLQLRSGQILPVSSNVAKALLSADSVLKAISSRDENRKYLFTLKCHCSFEKSRYGWCPLVYSIALSLILSHRPVVDPSSFSTRGVACVPHDDVSKVGPRSPNKRSGGRTTASVLSHISKRRTTLKQQVPMMGLIESDFTDSLIETPPMLPSPIEINTQRIDDDSNEQLSDKACNLPKVEAQGTVTKTAEAWKSPSSDILKKFGTTF